MKTVITYGTFDLFHIGHLNILKRARNFGDRLIVSLSTDEFNFSMKNKVTAIPYKDRKSILEALVYVDLVIPEESWEQKKADINLYDVDIFVMGSDWEGEFDFLSKHCEVIYLDRTEFISSTSIKQHIKSGVNNQIVGGAEGGVLP